MAQTHEASLCEAVGKNAVARGGAMTTEDRVEVVKDTTAVVAIITIVDRRLVD